MNNNQKPSMREFIETIRNKEMTDVVYRISKQAEENLYVLSQMLKSTPDQTLDTLLYYILINENCMRFLKDLS